MERQPFGRAKPFLATLATALGLAGCAVVIERPVTGPEVAAGGAPASVAMKSIFATPSAPVSLSGFQAWVAPLPADGAVGAWRDVTNDFTLAPRAADLVASGKLVLSAGRYRFRAVACWWINVTPSPTVPFTCLQSEVDVRVVPPSLTVAPSSLSLSAADTATVTVTATPPPGQDLSVALSSPLSSSLALTIPADTATAVTSPPFTATKAGASSLTASAGVPYGSAGMPLTVRPRLTSLSPTSGTTGTLVVVTGAGFAAPLTVRFGTVAVNVTPAGLTQAQVALPAGLTAGSTVQVSLESAGQTSSTQLPFTVSAAPPSGTLLFRSHATGIEVIRFTPAAGGTGASFGLIAPASVTATSPGLAVVGLRRSANTLLRASAMALEAFTIGGTAAAPTLTAAGRSPATGAGSAGLSGNGADAAVLSGQLVRGADRGLEVYQPGSSPLAQLSSVLNRPAAMSSGVSLLAHAAGGVLLRSTSGALELWDMSNSAAPTVTHNNISVFAAPLASGLAWLIPGQRLVRGFGFGIQVLTVSGGQTTVSGGNGTGGGGSFQAVAAGPAGRVVRTNGMSFEVYDLSFGANPVLCVKSNAGDASPTGVALAVDGDTVFRATSGGIEAWDLSALSCTSTPLSGSLPAPLIFRTGLSLATTGLGLAGPN